MIQFKTGDIFDSEAEALVNTVNCVGVMGRGIALQFKNAYPDNFRAYAAACKRHEVEPGRMFVFATHSLTGPKWIVNFPTKRHWRGKSRIEDIESGLSALVDVIRERSIRSIALPPLGSGLGGLRWSDVRPRIERAMANLGNVEVTVYEPSGAPKHQVRVAEPPPMTPGRAALVVLLGRYLDALLDPCASLLELHKLMYFMQEAGQPLRLKYVKAPLGPYAENLRHVLNRVEGHLISGYEDGGDSPDKQIELVPGAVADGHKALTNDFPAQQRLERVAELVDGFQTSFGLELLASVHWVATREAATTPAQAAALTHEWSPRKLKFTDRQISLAFNTLASKGWLKGSAATQQR